MKISKINENLNKKHAFKLYEIILFTFLVAVITFFLSFMVINMFQIPSLDKDAITWSKKDKNLTKFEEAYNLIDQSYYTDIDKEKLIDGAINGMLSSLSDPHTNYLNQDETDNFNNLMNGSYEGIGAELTINDKGEIIIITVFKNSPASEQGLKFNDIILEVNGKSVSGKTTTEVVGLIKDSKNPVAKIKIMRDSEVLNFDVEKRIVVIESVESKVIERENKRIGYLIVNTFANNTYDQFKEKLEALESEKIDSLIIDVRGNSGGYLHSVTNMLDLFLSKGTICYQIADKVNIYKHKAITNDKRQYPIAVLVNKASASASEILAISLKEAYGASIVGTNTYGKGTVQTTKNLNGGGMLKYTIQKWLSPNGNWVNGVGVEPTDYVELTSEYEKEPIDENDNQLQSAIDILLKK